MTNNCKDCRYFKAEEADEDYPYGDCACPKFLYLGDVKDRYKDKVGEDEFYEDYPTGLRVLCAGTTDELVYWDGEGYAAGFVVGPDFGCVHWAAASTSDSA